MNIRVSARERVQQFAQVYLADARSWLRPIAVSVRGQIPSRQSRIYPSKFAHDNHRTPD